MAEPEQDLGLLTEDEAAAFSNPVVENDEPETTSEDEKVDTGEPSPPEPEKQPEAEPQPAPDPSKVTPRVEPEPTPTPQIDGIITRDGKNFIPFGVLEQERSKRQQLEVELAEARKPKPAEPVPATERKPEATPQPIDLDDLFTKQGVNVEALAAKAYESQEGMAEVLKAVLTVGVNVGRQTARQTGEESARGVLFNEKITHLKAANAWLTPELEAISFMFAEQEAAKNPPKDVDALLKITEGALTKVKAMIKADQPAFDPEAERRKIRDEVTNEVMQKFNIKPAKIQTLGGVRNMNPEILSKFQQLDTLSGLDYEDAYAELTPQEKSAYDRQRA